MMRLHLGAGCGAGEAAQQVSPGLGCSGTGPLPYDPGPVLPGKPGTPVNMSPKSHWCQHMKFSEKDGFPEGTEN